MTLTQDEALSSKDTISIDKDMAAVTITDVSSPSSLQTSESDELFLHSWRLAAVIGSLCLGIFLLALDMNIIAVAIPRITSDFHALNDVAWYGSAYLLTVTAFQPLFGNLYKYFDPKMVYMGSIVLFELGSILCAAAPSSSVLIGGRSVLGFGAAGIHQGSLAIVNYVVELEKRPMYQGIVISSFVISVCVGPVLGGVFTDKASWRWCFWINVPMGAVVLVFIVLFFRINGVQNSNRALNLSTKLRRMDIGGVLLFLGAIYCLLLALQWGGQTMPWKSSKIIGLFVGFGLLIVSFGILQWKRGEHATIPLRILRQRSILMGSIFLMLFGMMSFVYAYYLPIYFQSIQGVTAIQSGTRFIAIVLPQIIGLSLTGVVVTKWGYYVPYMILGTIIAMVGAGLLTTIDTTTSTVKWAAYMIGSSVSVSIAQSLFLSKLQTSVPAHTTAVSAEAVIKVGASGLQDLAGGSEIVLTALREAYTIAIRDAMYYALAAACLSLPFCLRNAMVQPQKGCRGKEKSKERGEVGWGRDLGHGGQCDWFRESLDCMNT
ncbi:major facilitator superfamily transporter [Botrytis cinerea]